MSQMRMQAERAPAAASMSLPPSRAAATAAAGFSMTGMGGFSITVSSHPSGSRTCSSPRPYRRLIFIFTSRSRRNRLRSGPSSLIRSPLLNLRPPAGTLRSARGCMAMPVPGRPDERCACATGTNTARLRFRPTIPGTTCHPEQRAAEVSGAATTHAVRCSRYPLSAAAGRSDLRIASGKGRGKGRREGRRLPVAAHALEALVGAVQTPHVVAVLQAAFDGIVEAEVGPVDRFGLLYPPLLEKQRAQGMAGADASRARARCRPAGRCGAPPPGGGRNRPRGLPGDRQFLRRASPGRPP